MEGSDRDDDVEVDEVVNGVEYDEAKDDGMQGDNGQGGEG